jgi:CHAT domain-containing protein
MLREQAHQARADLNAAIKRLRDLSGYEDFLAQPDFDDLAGAVQPNVPLVYLATTPTGSLALIVHRRSDAAEVAVEPVWRDEFTGAHLRELLVGPADAPQMGGWFGAYGRWRDQPRDQAAREAWLVTLERATRRLWEELMGPVVGCLQTLGVPQAVLIPTGWLALLPLHAAWTEQDGRRCYALDRVAFAYAPSARVLTHARRVAAATTGEQLFAVENPDGSLRHAAQEVQGIAGHFSEPWVVRGDRATRNTTLAALPQCDVYHFACHGRNAWQDPLESALQMASSVSFTVGDLLSAGNKAQGRLAFLSACETGLIGTALPDEVVGLAAGFLQAGAAGVVSTLWAVNDQSTALLAGRFYENWKGQGMTPLQALVAAQQWLRDEADGGRWKHPYYWGAFTLTGT